LSFLDDLLGWLNPPPAPRPPDKPTTPVAAPNPDPGETKSGEVKPTRKPRVHKTLKGRVVYNRKRHFVNIRAAERFLKAFLLTNDGKKEGILEVAADLIAVLGVIGRIIGAYLNPAAMEVVNKAIQSISETLLEVLRGNKSGS